MIHIVLFKDGKKYKDFYFYDLLTGLKWIKDNIPEFDYIVVDDETTVKRFEFNRYFNAINDYYRKVYGNWY